MSRSRKKHPSCSVVCYFSNKKSRSRANRKLRRCTKAVIDSLMHNRGGDTPLIYALDEADCFKKLREVSDTYDFDSDGLPGVYDMHQKISDWTQDDYSYHDRGHVKKTTLAEAVRNHNYKLYKNYFNK